MTRMAYGYVIAQITVTDPEVYPTYVAMVQPTIEAFGGEFIVRGGRSESHEGTPPGERLPIPRAGGPLLSAHLSHAAQVFGDLHGTHLPGKAGAIDMQRLGDPHHVVARL